MGTIKKRYIVIFSLLLLVGISSVIIIIYFPNLFRKHTIPKTVDVFGAPSAQTSQNFPADHPQFTAQIGKIKPASVQQQSISVFQIGDTKKAVVFKRPFYADEFRGDALTYAFAKDVPLITQSGILRTLGCKADGCSISWSNFYTWDTGSQTFVLDNADHKDEFQRLLTSYQTIDKNGCAIVGGQILPDQEGLSFTNIYKKFPTAAYYCSKTQGLLPSNLVFFLQTERALEEIVNGQNIGSADIRDISL